MGKIVLMTGSGISADSGISTFRTEDKAALWENHNPMTVCDYRTWKSNFELVHRFYNERRNQLSQVEPNDAHRMIADWENRYSTKIYTQNVDDLLERAGTKEVVHVHGFLTKMSCEACGRTWDIGYKQWDVTTDRCACGNSKNVKPAVVFFNEQAPEYPEMFRILSELTEDDVLIVWGTSGVVIDIGSWAAHSKATTILSNLKSEDVSWTMSDACIRDEDFDYVIHGPAAETAHMLDALVQSLMD